MSAAVSSNAGPSYQPFQCTVCERRFTRHENLKRHAALHTRSEDSACFTCDSCPTTFSRRDLLRRHKKKKHPGEEEPRSSVARTRPQGERPRSDEEVRSPTSSLIGQERRLQSSTGTADFDVDIGDWEMALPDAAHLSSSMPNDNDMEQDPLAEAGASIEQSSYAEHPVDDAVGFAQSLLSESSVLGGQVTATLNSRAGRDFLSSIPSGLSPKDLPYLQEDWLPSATQVARGIALYFAYVSHFFPFVHRPTFDASQAASHLILSMLCIAYQYGEDPDCDDREGSGAALSLHCFHRARILVASNEEGEEDAKQKLVMVQAYLLLEVHAMLYLCGQDSSYGLKIHPKMVGLARSGGLMQPMQTKPTATKDLDSLWREFVKAESHKRTLLAVHQLDALWYQILSMPRLLSHLEIKHDLPCPEACWTSSSAAEWAHRQLVTNQSVPTIRYSEAVRHFLSPNPDAESLPQFDPYGAINITPFLLSSVREVSGWSTMTGRLSLERFEPLKSSLDALEPYVRPRPNEDVGTHAVSAEATWEMAMIELQSWSPSHTGGIVETSLDAALATATYLSMSCGSLFDPASAKAMGPHLDWFLLYLERTITPDCEPPWVSVYAFKAFLIVWQLVRANSPGAMQAVGVDDGDVGEALVWARKVFARRSSRQLGKLFMTSLTSLEEMAG